MIVCITDELLKWRKIIVSSRSKHSKTFSENIDGFVFLLLTHQKMCAPFILKQLLFYARGITCVSTKKNVQSNTNARDRDRKRYHARSIETRHRQGRVKQLFDSKQWTIATKPRTTITNEGSGLEWTRCHSHNNPIAVFTIVCTGIEVGAVT